MAWEVDWGNKNNTGEKVWGRNPESHIKKAKEWHWVTTGSLRRAGIKTPKYRKDSWEIDWENRNGKLVWARNVSSKMPSAKDWHWVDFHTLERAGLNWKPKTEKTGRRIDVNGYCILSRRGMSEEDVAICCKAGLFRGKRKNFVREHHLVAVKKYGSIPAGNVVRHLNGDKQDNRPENLLLGTTQENTSDHNTARLMAIYWREKYEQAALEIQLLKKQMSGDQ